MFKETEISRRQMLRLCGAGAVGAGTLGWLDVVANRAAAAGAKPKSCILLWMPGGPSQGDTFDPKPGLNDKLGIAKPMASSVPGIQISEYLPKVAQQMRHLALLRSMSTGDFNHQTATTLMRTGFRAGDGGLVHPHLGATVAYDRQQDQPDPELPNFVFLGAQRLLGVGAGFLGPKCAPLILTQPDRGIPNLKPSDDFAKVDKRADLVAKLDTEFLRSYQAEAIDAHLNAYQSALRLMRCDKAVKAFNLDEEKPAVRESYGKTKFGERCLVARRLVEAGVSFVEVQWEGGEGHWDTHNGPTGQQKQVEALDGPMAALIADLADRGRLESTLVVWAGEFGRSMSPSSNHHAKSWSTVLAGGGLKTGQVVGRTDDRAMEVTDRPISVADYASTIFKALRVNYDRKVRVRGRQIHLVDKGPGGDRKPALIDQLF